VFQFSHFLRLISLFKICSLSDVPEFANQVLQNGVNPRQGKKSDQAHPPIHPTKYTDGLSGNERRVYEFIVRRFLACVSKDAEGLETVVKIDVHGEKVIFRCSNVG
jgi:DNA topoisomerase-3